ncbi:MAG: glycosyltransferase family 1 protein, partial [Verrucomicrobiae bacterium]|nr:glycosyltransferase family 1 protein [Verrucomicrobiae bacterium]
MKIEIVTDTFVPDVNGVAMTLGRLTEGLRKRGHRVHVVHTGSTAGAGETSATAVPLPGYREVRVGLPRYFDLRARWSRKRPDAIYVATESPLGKSAIKAARALKIPVAAGFHTNFHEYMEQYRVGMLQPMALAYLRRFHHHADCTLVPSRDIMERLSAEGFERVHLLGRGVDTALFHPAKRCEALRAEWGARPKTPVVIIVGRVAAEKNLDLAMSTFHRMRAVVPDVRCVVVGDGPLRARLEAAHPAVHFAGVRSGDDLARHYASADILLFPSETETFGNVLLEGMASGLSTVSYDYAAAGLHVSHGSNGWKAPKGDAKAYAHLAIHAMTHEGASAIREEARKSALLLGWDSVIDGFEGKLSEIAGIRPTEEPKASPKKGKRPKLSCRSVFL